MKNVENYFNIKGFLTSSYSKDLGMEDLWAKYLDEVFPTQSVSQLVVYTDSHRYWFVDPLLAVGQQYGWKVSVTLVDDIDEEYLSEVKQSFSTLSQSCLLVFAFSEKNPNISDLVALIHPLQGIARYAGYSLVVIESFPDQYLPEFLNGSISNIQERYDDLMRVMKRGFSIESTVGTYLETKCSTVTSFPYLTNSSSKHVLFPAYQVVGKIETLATHGTIVVDRTISPISENQELIDPMGLANQHPIHMLIEEGQIVDISLPSSPPTHLFRRLNTYLSAKLPLLIDTIAVGLGPATLPTGILEVDHLSSNSVSFLVNEVLVQLNLSYHKLQAL